MNCAHCLSAKITKLKAATKLGYKQYNERTGTKLNNIEYPTEVVMMAVHYYYRFKVSFDDVVELMAMRNIFLSHQTVHNWVQTFGVELGLKLREQRKGKCSKKWHTDATYISIKGHWYYLYRAIDKESNLVDVYLSDVRDQEAAEAFFKHTEKATGITPEQITTDKEKALYSAIESVFGKSAKHRDVKYLNNTIEQDHRGIKSRYKVMKGFKDSWCAMLFCTAFEEIRQFFRMKDKTRGECRRLIASRINSFNALMELTL